MILAGANTYSGSTTVGGGTLQIGAGGAGSSLASPSVSLGNSTLLAFNHSDSMTYGGVITGSGRLLKQGAGTLTLVGANTYSGATAIGGGTLKLAAPYVAPTLANASFETPNLAGGFQYDPAGATWTFLDYSGIAAGSSAFTAPTPVPDGSQVALIQAAGNAGSFSQIVNFATAGSYTISFQGAYRQFTSTPEPFNVEVDGVNEGLFVPSSDTAWTPYTTSAFSVSAGAHTIAFVGQADGVDRTSFVDSVAVTLVGTYAPGLPAATPVSVISGAAFDVNGNSQQVASLSDYTAGSGGTVVNSNTSIVSTLTLSATGGASTFSGVIAGGGTLGTLNLVMSGSGTQVLAGSNTYTGSTTINGGTLQIGAGGTTGSINSTDAVTDNAVLAFSCSGTLTFSVPISGSGTVTMLGPGTLALGGSNTYTGGTTLSAGQLNINNAAALGTGALTISGGTIGNTSGAAITLSNNNAENWNGNFAFAGTNDLNLGTGAVAMSSSRTVTVTSNNLTVGGAISGSGYSLTKAGAGTLTLAGSNTYTGGTTLSAGQLNINNAAALGTGTFTISGGTIGNTSGAAITLSNNNAESWSGNFTFAGTSDLNLGTGRRHEQQPHGDGRIQQPHRRGRDQRQRLQSNQGGRRHADTGGLERLHRRHDALRGAIEHQRRRRPGHRDLHDLRRNHRQHQRRGDHAFQEQRPKLERQLHVRRANDLNLGTGAVTMSSSRTVTVASGNLTVGGAIGGSGYRLTKAGAGTLTLAASNTYTGGTTLSAGQLNINNAAALGTGTFTISGGTIGNTSGAAITLSKSNAQSWSGNFAFTGTNDLNLGTGAVTMSSSRTVTVASNTLTVGGVISGSGYSLTKAGTGMLVLTGSDTYSGGTVVSSGNLRVNGSLSSSTSVSDSSAATLSGTGSVGNVTVSASGTVAPGLTAGGSLTANSLVLSTSSVLSYTLGSGTATDSRLKIPAP